MKGSKSREVRGTCFFLGSSMQQEKLSEVPWINPDFVVMEETKNIICSKSNCEPLILVDISSKKTKEIEHPFNTLDTSESKETGNSIKCQSLSKDIIAILNIYTGKLVLHDLRTPDDFMNLSESSKTNSNEIWTISKHDTNTSPNYFGILSNKQSLCIYDKRTNCQLFRSVGVNSQKNYYNNFKLKFCKKEDKFSVSGLDSNVNVFSMINNTFSQVFTHNGHNPSTLSMKYVTDHIWLPVQDKELIVSICENKTLNCWDFRVKD